MKFSIKIFFFSSRRRHTRYWRDWSSDVCSSDLNCSVCHCYHVSRAQLGALAPPAINLAFLAAYPVAKGTSALTRALEGA